MKKNKNQKKNQNKLFVIFSAVVVAVIFGATFLFKEDPKKINSDRVDSALLIKEHSYSKGVSDAKVTIVEFFDPECESCRELHPIVNRLYNEFSGKVRIVYRYTPFHANSVYAISVLEEAKANGKFEEALEAMFENQPVWGDHHKPKPELIPGYMEKIGLNKNLFDRNSVISKHQSKIEIDKHDGKSLGVNQTPTFFVNGRKLYNIDYPFIKMAIEDELKVP